MDDIGRPIRTGITSMSDWLGIKFIVDALDNKPGVSEAIGGILVVLLVGAWYSLATFQGWRIWDKAEADRLAITQLGLPVSEGPFVLDAGKGENYGGVRESNTPFRIAALDRINGAWLFLAASIALPAALLAMTIWPAGEDDAYSGVWEFLAEPWVRCGAAAILLVLCAGLLWGRIGRALGGWHFPWQAPFQPPGRPPGTATPVQPVPPTPPGLPAA